MNSKGINVLSLFDGMGCGWIALKELGIKVNHAYASEVDKFAISQTTYNFPEVVHLGSVTDVDVSKLEPIDLLIGGSPCFAAGTMVLTDNGYKPIEEVKVGDMVLTHKNRYRKVLRIGGKVAKTYILNAAGFVPTICTENHPFYARKKSKQYYVAENGKRNCRVVLEEPEWINASSLPGEYRVSCNICNDDDANLYNITEEEAYVIGRYIADGHTRKDVRYDRKPNGNKGHNGSRAWQLILSIGNSKVEQFRNKIKELHFSCYPHGESVHRVVFSNKRLVEFVESYCGIGSENKMFGDAVVKLPKHLLENVLEGYLDGDGCLVRGVYNITSVSLMLPITLQRVVSKLYGRHIGVYRHIPKEERILLGRRVKQKPQYIVRFSKDRKKYEKAIVIGDKIWQNVKSLTPSETRMVYNMEVEEDNSYTANNFVVHNCQNLSFAGRRNGLSTTDKEEIHTLDRYLQLKEEGFQFDGQSYLFWEYMRILNDIRKYNPHVMFLLENVEMGKKWEAVFNEAIGLRGVHINAALVSAQNRRRIYWTNIRVNQDLIGGGKFSDIPQPEDRGIFLKDILEEIVDEKYYLKDEVVRKLIEHRERNIANGNGFGAKPRGLDEKMNSVSVKGKGMYDLVKDGK